MLGGRTKIDRSSFLKSAKQQWPDLAQAINREEGLLHFEVSHIKNKIQSQIDSGFEHDLAESFNFIELAYNKGDSKIRDAIDVSIIEPLEFQDHAKLRRQWAWTLLPNTLKKLYEDFHGPWK